METIYIIIVLIILIIGISIIYSHIKIDISIYNIYNIYNNKIDKDIKIIYLSDLHNRDIINKLINIINNIKPDIIIFGGDMINEYIKETNNFYKLIELLDNKNIYYTFGNHEEQLIDNEKKEYLDIINKSNIYLLNNKYIDLSKNIKLYGLNNGIETYLKFKKTGLTKEYIQKKLGSFDNKHFNILIAHNPLEFSSYVDTNADLVLSGHVHGGVIRGLLSPDYSFFPKYYSGMYKKNNTKMIVSRGLGYSKRIPFRLFNPAEVVVINIKTKV